MKLILVFFVLLIMAVLSGCGRDGEPATNQVPGIHVAPDSACLVKNFCTTSNKDPRGGPVWCESLRWEPALRPELNYEGHPCIVTSEDHELIDPACDLNSPTETCYVWGNSRPCCHTKQGPGPVGTP